MIRAYAALALMCAVPAQARVLTVGPGAMFPAPSAAARDAQTGDTIEIAAGSYYDCATWSQSGLTIEGTGADTVITDNACQGKAAFVIDGNNVTVRHLVLTRIRVPDGSGAGIRGEGSNLKIEDVGFINNQIGILYGTGHGAVRIVGCRFDDDGDSPEGRPTHAVRVSADTLEIESSTFTHPRAGDHVDAEAKQISLTGDTFDDGNGRMQGPLLHIQADVVVFDGNTITLSPNAAERAGAVLIDGPPGAIKVEDNVLIEPAGTFPLVRNWTGAAAEVHGNRVPPGIDAETSSGRLWHVTRGYLGAARAYAVQYLGRAHHIAGVILDRLRSKL